MRYLLFLFLIYACSAIQPLKKEEQFSSGFNETIVEVKKKIAANNLNEARLQLLKLNDEQLTDIEKAEKYNVLGLIYFNNNDFEKAKDRFAKALSFDFNEKELVNQISLNLASTEYKLQNYAHSFQLLNNIEAKQLGEKDRKKVYLLRYINAQRLNNEDQQVFALSGLLSDIKEKKDLLGNRYYKILSFEFFKFDKQKQLRVLKDMADENESLVVAHLANNLSLKFYRDGDKDAYKNVREWINDTFSNYQLDDVESARDNVSVYEEIDPQVVGVILPLSGDKAAFAQKVLMGITLALKKLKDPFKIVVKDSRNSANHAASQIKKLIYDHKAALIIGGLFIQTAQREYEIALQKGVAYISLTPLYIERTKKTPGLIEIPGSVESQVSALFSEKIAKKLGKSFALLYPEGDIGESYLNEIWRQSDARQFELVTVASFPQDVNDYRPYIGPLVGLKYKRERSEEYKVWEDIYKTKYDDISRIQILKPIVEFDWVFIPSYPQDAIKIIPSFQYLGVKNVPYIGGPSWRSRTLIAQKKNLGDLYFISNLEDAGKTQFRNIFFQEYKKEPKLLETLGFESVYVANQMLDGSDWARRSDLNDSLAKKESLKGYLGHWSLQENIWFKAIEIGKITSTGTVSL
ncbi:MAG: ABC transporter substrate-binding protein [Halobacteriovoraceae bacterium]|nr:ABC transporter substrate-binding protein [Halobacteriovoraceae bacterium]